MTEPEKIEFIKGNEDPNAPAKWRRYLKSKGVICTNFHNTILACLECGGTWQPMMKKGGGFCRNYTKCPHCQ